MPLQRDGHALTLERDGHALALERDGHALALHRAAQWPRQHDIFRSAGRIGGDRRPTGSPTLAEKVRYAALRLSFETDTYCFLFEPIFLTTSEFGTFTVTAKT